MTVVINGSSGITDVDGTAAAPALTGTDTDTGTFFPAANTIAWSTGGTEAMRINSSQNVGIGTSSPNAKLDVSGGSIRVNEDGVGTKVLTIRSNWAGVDPAINVTTNNSLLLMTNNAERARIDSSGNLLVGKTNASEANVGTAFGVGGDSYFTRSGSTNSNSTLHVYSTGAGAFRFYVGMGGTVYATSTTITAISDQRLKENIQDIDAGLTQVLALKPRKFDWKEGKGKNKKGDRGWIAQEFEQVFPEMIDEWRDPAPEGEEPYKAVNADLIPVLVKAIQELKAELDATKAEVAALKGQ